VLQAAKAQINAAEPASEQVVLKGLDVVAGPGRGGIEAAGLGLVKKVID
jgi:hypothetical protein